MVGSCEQGNEPLGGTKDREFPDQLSEHPVMIDSRPSYIINFDTSLEITNENMQIYNPQLICGRYSEGNVCITQAAPGLFFTIIAFLQEVM
jgi:hypothetical protein